MLCRKLGGMCECYIRNPGRWFFLLFFFHNLFSFSKEMSIFYFCAGLNTPFNSLSLTLLKPYSHVVALLYTFPSLSPIIQRRGFLAFLLPSSFPLPVVCDPVPPAHTLYPYPAMQALYWSTSDAQSAAGSLAVEKSMHSSRFCFSSLHTQHGCPLCQYARTHTAFVGVDSLRDGGKGAGLRTLGLFSVDVAAGVAAAAEGVSGGGGSATVSEKENPPP